MDNYFWYEALGYLFIIGGIVMVPWIKNRFILGLPFIIGVFIKYVHFLISLDVLTPDTFISGMAIVIIMLMYLFFTCSKITSD